MNDLRGIDFNFSMARLVISMGLLGEKRKEECDSMVKLDGEAKMYYFLPETWWRTWVKFVKHNGEGLGSLILRVYLKRRES